MGEVLSLGLAAALGVLLGAFFVGGLWWTVRFRLGREQPALWFVGSLALRLALTLAGFYLVGRNDWQRLVACLLGFIAARLAIQWLTRLHARSELPPAPEARAPCT